MLHAPKNKIALCLLLLIFVTQTTSAFNAGVFWYLYTFSLLICMAVTVVQGEFFDEQPTWHYLMYGIGYGTLLYGIVRVSYEILVKLFPTTKQSIAMFLESYGPTNIWHFSLLILIIVVGEEMFWRGFVQQQLKQHMSTLYAVLTASFLFSLSLLILGFVLGAVCAFVAGIIFGLLYEWKRSLPMIIVMHAVFVILLFLVLPLPL